MRAVIFDGSLRLEKNYPEPAPQKGEALIKTSLVGICNTDIEITRGYMNFKGILGHEFVGIVEEVKTSGENLKNLIGERIVGEINCGCGRCSYCRSGNRNHCPNRKVLGIYRKDGAMADYLTLPFENLHTIPEEISNEEAVFIEPLASAFEILEQVKINKKSKILIMGDGKLGLLAGLVLSNYYNNVIVLGKHKNKLKILEKEGIKTILLPEVKPEKNFDLVIDATGSQKALETALMFAKPQGTIVMKTTVAEKRLIDLNPAVIDEIKIIGSRCGPFEKTIEALKKKMFNVKPLISKIFKANNALDAFKYASKRDTIKVLIDFH